MDEPGPPERSDDAERESQIANVALLLFLLMLVGAGYWLVSAMLEHRAMEECLAQGRRNCAPIEAPPR